MKLKLDWGVRMKLVSIASMLTGATMSGSLSNKEALIIGLRELAQTLEDMPEDNKK